MSRIKADLICEIIRKSQSNFFEKKGWADPETLEISEILVLVWVRNNAKQYREFFCEKLETCSNTELGAILKLVAESGKDLTEILNGSPQFNSKTKLP